MAISLTESDFSVSERVSFDRHLFQQKLKPHNAVNESLAAPLSASFLPTPSALFDNKFIRQIIPSLTASRSPSPHSSASSSPRIVLPDDVDPSRFSAYRSFIESKRSIASSIVHSIPKLNLALEGGGSRAMAQVGCLLELDSHGLLAPILNVAGASGGALVAFSLALGKSAGETMELINDTDFSAWQDSGYAKRLHQQFADSTLSFISSLFSSGKEAGYHPNTNYADLISYSNITGVLKGGAWGTERPEQFLRDQIKRCLGIESGRLTFREHHQLVIASRSPSTNNIPNNRVLKNLYVCATLLDERAPDRRKVFSYKLTPHVDIVTAVLASMAFPFGFQPVLIDGLVFSDGGIERNYPIDVFDSLRPDDIDFYPEGMGLKPFVLIDPITNAETKINPFVLGIKIDTSEECSTILLPPHHHDEAIRKEALNRFFGPFHLSSVFMSKLQVITEREREERRRVHQHYPFHTIQIHDTGISTLNFALTPLQKLALVLNGRSATAAYLEWGKNIQTTPLPYPLPGILHPEAQWPLEILGAIHTHRFLDALNILKWDCPSSIFPLVIAALYREINDDKYRTFFEKKETVTQYAALKAFVTLNMQEFANQTQISDASASSSSSSSSSSFAVDRFSKTGMKGRSVAAALGTGVVLGSLAIAWPVVLGGAAISGAAIYKFSKEAAKAECDGAEKEFKEEKTRSDACEAIRKAWTENESNGIKLMTEYNHTIKRFVKAGNYNEATLMLGIGHRCSLYQLCADNEIKSLIDEIIARDSSTTLSHLNLETKAKYHQLLLTMHRIRASRIDDTKLVSVANELINNREYAFARLYILSAQHRYILTAENVLSLRDALIASKNSLSNVVFNNSDNYDVLLTYLELLIEHVKQLEIHALHYRGIHSNHK